MRRITAAGEARTLVPERVWQETERALGESRPEVFFETLRACGALAVIFPEVDALFGVPQPPKWHPEIDTGVHVMLSLRYAADHGAPGHRALRGAAARPRQGADAPGELAEPPWPRGVRRAADRGSVRSPEGPQRPPRAGDPHRAPAHPGAPRAGTEAGHRADAAGELRRAAPARALRGNAVSPARPMRAAAPDASRSPIRRRPTCAPPSPPPPR